MEINNLAEKPLVEDSKAPQGLGSISSVFTKNLFIILIVAVILGVITGYVFRSAGTKGGNALISGNIEASQITKGTVVGSDDTKTFKDVTQGALKKGGIDGEGQYHLVRPGGDSQNVYLTSSSVDLSKFIDRKIKVWGQTQAAQHAGWLMDVGRVEVL